MPHWHGYVRRRGNKRGQSNHPHRLGSPLGKEATPDSSGPPNSFDHKPGWVEIGDHIRKCIFLMVHLLGIDMIIEIQLSLF